METVGSFKAIIPNAKGALKGLRLDYVVLYECVGCIPCLGVLLFVNKLLQYKINLIILKLIVSLKSLSPREGSLLQTVHVRYIVKAKETQLYMQLRLHSHLNMNGIWLLSECIVQDHEPQYIYISRVTNMKYSPDVKPLSIMNCAIGLHFFFNTSMSLFLSLHHLRGYTSSLSYLQNRLSGINGFLGQLSVDRQLSSSPTIRVFSTGDNFSFTPSMRQIIDN